MNPSIRRMGEYSPVERLENAENEFTMPIPVYAEVGAGNDIELVEEVPICTISILKSYYTDTRMYAALVSGDSMTPTIKKGAYVGIVPMYGQLEEGGRSTLCNARILGGWSNAFSYPQTPSALSCAQTIPNLKI